MITAAGFNHDALVRLASTYRTSWSLAVRQAVRAGVLHQSDAVAWLPEQQAGMAGSA